VLRENDGLSLFALDPLQLVQEPPQLGGVQNVFYDSKALSGLARNEGGCLLMIEPQAFDNVGIKVGQQRLFEAGNFYPDFILWRIDGQKQGITFVDPKGIRNLSWNDPKLKFGETIKEVEQRMNDHMVELASFIVSNTPASEMALHWSKTSTEMTARNIVFQENAPDYIEALLK
jgi:hypothetical protein